MKCGGWPCRAALVKYRMNVSVVLNYILANRPHARKRSEVRSSASILQQGSRGVYPAARRHHLRCKPHARSCSHNERARVLCLWPAADQGQGPLQPADTRGSVARFGARIDELSRKTGSRMKDRTLSASPTIAGLFLPPFEKGSACWLEVPVGDCLQESEAPRGETRVRLHSDALGGSRPSMISGKERRRMVTPKHHHRHNLTGPYSLDWILDPAHRCHRRA